MGEGSPQRASAAEKIAQGQTRLRHCKSEWKEGQAVCNPRSSALAWKRGVSAGTGDRKENKKDTPKWVLLAST